MIVTLVASTIFVLVLNGPITAKLSMSYGNEVGSPDGDDGDGGDDDDSSGSNNDNINNNNSLNKFNTYWEILLFL